jgi:branched-chain amino acid aminotransferase
MTKGPPIFRLGWDKSVFYVSHIFLLEIPYSKREIEDAIKKTVKINKVKECYIRPLVYIGYGAMGLYPKDNPVRVAVSVWPWGSYLGDDGLKNGIRVKVSSFIRNHVNSQMSRAKVCGYYINSQLAKKEAISLGYDEAILLDTDGYVAEGSGENIFIVRNGRLKTTPLTSVLEGITRESIMQIARERLCHKNSEPQAVGRFTPASEVTPIRVDERNRRRRVEGLQRTAVCILWRERRIKHYHDYKNLKIFSK